MDLGLEGKRAIVTGGSRGIGLAVARGLAGEGVDLALVARSEGPLREAAETVAAESGRRVEAIPADTGDDASVTSMAARAVELLGGVDILVNCAARPGGGAAVRFDQTTTDYFHEEMNTKVMGYLRTAQAVAPHMQEAGWGRIVNVSGLAARQAGSAVGSMRNVAVAALTKNLADELGRHGINVTVVHPGLTWTERMPAFVAERARASGISEEEMRARLDEGNVLRRMIDAAEVADVVVFLCSPRSSAITGDAIAVGGGAPRAIYY